MNVSVDTLDIVHISDTHCGRKGPGVYRAAGAHRGHGRVVDALREALTELVTEADVETAAVLSGDLSVMGDRRDIGETLYWWGGCAGRRRSYVLGNHDFWNGHPSRTALSHEKIHGLVREAHWPQDEVTTIPVGAMRVTIYEADTTPFSGLSGLCTNVFAKGELPEGRFAPASLDRTPWSSGPDIAVIVMHHPVQVLRRSLNKIVELRQDQRINLVLTGHTHAFATARYGFAQVTCASSTLGHKRERPSFLIHRLTCEDGQSVTLQITMWTFDGHDFRPQLLPGINSLT